MPHKMLPAEIVSMILLSKQEAESWRQSQKEAIFSQMAVLEGSKRLQTVLAETKYDRQSQQEAKVGGQVYTL